jgi:hypothetical protein
MMPRFPFSPLGASSPSSPSRSIRAAISLDALTSCRCRPPLASRARSARRPGNPVPATASIAGARYQSSPGDWTKGEIQGAPPVGFACLKFTMDAPQYHAYSFTSSGTLGNSDE